MSSKRLVTCPYNEAHKVKESRYQLHISKCRENQDEKEEKFICPFNATHVMTKPERTYHMQHCPDRATVDRTLSQSLNRNNPYQGRTAVPSYSEAPLVVAEEEWDLDDNNQGIVPQVKEAPTGAIIEPPAKSKPAERRKLYQELHRMAEKDLEQPPTQSEEPSVLKAPQQPDAVSKIEALRKRTDLVNLGLGQNRSIPPQRIAANIFPGGQVENGFSNALKNLSISKETPSAPFRPNENEFPVLGVGRGRSLKR